MATAEIYWICEFRSKHGNQFHIWYRDPYKNKWMVGQTIHNGAVIHGPLIRQFN